MAKDKKYNLEQRARRAAPPVAKATLRNVRIGHRKLRLSVDLVRGRQVETALQILQFDKRKGSAIVHKLLTSAVANAREAQSANVDRLWVTDAYVDTARTMKRTLPRARGSADQLLKRSSHVTVVVGEQK